jgi:hypothetical protein
MHPVRQLYQHHIHLLLVNRGYHSRSRCISGYEQETAPRRTSLQVNAAHTSEAIALTGEVALCEIFSHFVEPLARNRCILFLEWVAHHMRHIGLVHCVQKRPYVP